MKEEFDIDKIGKQLPYQVPSGFFEEITSQTLAEAKRRSSSSKSILFSSWKVFSVAASVAILLVAGYLFFMGGQDVTPKLAQVKPAQVQVRDVEVEQEPVASPVIKEELKVAVLPKPTRSETTAKPSLSNQVARVSKRAKTETLEDLLAGISDEELQQLVAMAESEEHVYEETIE